MQVSLSNIPIFCLTCQDETTGEDMSKRVHIADQFCNMNLSGDFVMPIVGIAKNKSGASGFFRMIERGLRLQTHDKPFQPFLMIEDDISFVTNTETIHIPNDTDILYAGLSICSMNSYMFHYANYYESVDGFPQIVRVKHMLASHGIMVCSALGASVLQRTMLEVFLSDKAWDIPLAFIQPYYNVYALRRPWVYQDSKYGGDEACTRITFEGGDNKLPDDWKNNDLATIKMRESI